LSGARERTAASERSDCGIDNKEVPIDEVMRDDTAFARTYVNNRGRAN
jgi:hypothetical protein